MEIDDQNRPVVYLAYWKDRTVSGFCVFETAKEAIRYARANCNINMDWSSFPSPRKEYPYDDRDGSRPELTPMFVATWGEGPNWGCALVERCTVFPKFWMEEREAA